VLSRDGICEIEEHQSYLSIRQPVCLDNKNNFYI